MSQLIPISDLNPTRRFAVVTVVLIALNVVAFVQTPQFGLGTRSTVYFFENAPVPCQLEDSCPNDEILPGLRIPERNFGSFLMSIVVSTFLHGGPIHLAGNMLFLWVFGNNIEDRLGRVKYILFYLLGGVAAAFAHIYWTLARAPEACTNADPSACIPAVGASGAVAAIMGAYILLFPRARVNVLVAIFVLWTVIQLSAFAVLGLWFLYQFLIGSQEFSGATEVAWMAHVGGFVYGVVVMFFLGGRPHKPPEVWRPEWGY
ncbi:MAG TPA: rhomboid family intramembrane serine protease [Actinomycetota bacterium]|nr:rhomboid family intramembrane serine protease [Actinomycetota bacterium]